MYYTTVYTKGLCKQGESMEFVNRGASQPAAAKPNTTAGGGKRKWKDNPLWLRVVWVVLLFSVTIVVVALATLLYFGSSKEADQVDPNKQQAVFLTNGQVYFGKIKEINGKYVDLRGIYYLNVNQQVQPNQQDANGESKPQNNISLVKLGCELHGPQDQMIINRDQVTFWENLKDEGQVAKAINEWVRQNPNGQTCQTSNS